MSKLPNAEYHFANKTPVRSLRPGGAGGIIVACNKCGEAVALVTSPRTGKKYTCELTPELTPRCKPWQPHFKNCTG